MNYAKTPCLLHSAELAQTRVVINESYASSVWEPDAVPGRTPRPRLRPSQQPCVNISIFASEETEASGREVKRFAHNDDPTSQEFFSPSIEKGIERDTNELAKLPQLIKWLFSSSSSSRSPVLSISIHALFSVLTPVYLKLYCELQ